MKNTNDYDENKDETSQRQDSNEIVDNPETIDTSRNESVINTTKEEEALIKRLMSMNFKDRVMQYVIDIVTSCGGEMIELEKENIKVPGKDKWEKLSIIPLMPLVGLNHRQPILHMSKIMVHCYTTDETINLFAIGYMINPSLNCTKVFIIKIEICLSLLFAASKIKAIQDCLMKKNTCVMALIIICEKNGEIKCIEC